MRGILLRYVIVIACLLLSQNAISQSNVIDEVSKYVYVEGDVIDSLKMMQLLRDKIEKADKEIHDLKYYNNNLEQLIAIGNKNGKIMDENLYNQSLKIFESYLSFKQEMELNKNDRKWLSSNSELINLVYKLQEVEGELNLTGKNNEQKVEKMLKKQKMSILFVPYLQQLLANSKYKVLEIKQRSRMITPEEIPYKKEEVKVLNPYNRNYLYVNDNRYLDSLDYIMQKKDWEWAYTEKSEEAFTAYPRSIHFNKYKSHPDLRFIGDYGKKVFNSEGNLVYYTYILRNDKNILRALKEELLKEIYIKDYKSNKYDILKASSKTQEDVKNMLGLPFKTFVDAKTAKKNQKIVNDYIKTQVDEVKASNGSRQQRERAKARANNAKMNIGALLFSAMTDKDFVAANSFVEQLKEDHKNDLYGIYKISRINNTSFKVAFMNKEYKSSYTGLITIKQTGKFQCDFEYKLVTNDQDIEINPLDYPKIEQQKTTKKTRSY